MATQDTNTISKLKTITSHVGVSRFFDECTGRHGDRPIGCIPRRDDVPSPYAYSPTWYVYDWHGVPVILREVSHKRYVVYQVGGPLLPVEDAS